MKTRKRGFLRTMVSALAIFMALTLAAPAALAKGYELDNFAGPDNLIYGGKFYSEFSSLDEVFEAAKKLNGEVVAEGTVLLKNNGTLPLDPRTDKISVLGVRSGDLREGVDGTLVEPNAVSPMAEGLRNAGFTVNPVLEKWYQRVPNRVEMQEVGIAGFEPLFSEAVNRSFENYNDVAVVVIQRCEMKENVGGSVALTGHTTNTGDVNDPVMACWPATVPTTASVRSRILWLKVRLKPTPTAGSTLIPLSPPPRKAKWRLLT